MMFLDVGLPLEVLLKDGKLSGTRIQVESSVGSKASMLYWMMNDEWRLDLLQRLAASRISTIV
jgi:hypothetical protein